MNLDIRGQFSWKKKMLIHSMDKIIRSLSTFGTILFYIFHNLLLFILACECLHFVSSANVKPKERVPLPWPFTLIFKCIN